MVNCKDLVHITNHQCLQFSMIGSELGGLKTELKYVRALCVRGVQNNRLTEKTEKTEEKLTEKTEPK